MVNYLRPTPNATIQSEALAQWSGKTVLGAWYDSDGWYNAGSSLAQTPLSGITIGKFLVTDASDFIVTDSGAFIVTETINNAGFCGAASDGASGAWFCQHYGVLANMAADGTLTIFNLPEQTAFEGVIYHPGFNAPYALAASGSIYTPNGSGLIAVGGGFGAVQDAKGLAVSGNTMFTVLAAEQAIGTFHLTAIHAGTSGSIAAPMLVPGAVIASTTISGLAALGWNYASVTSGFVGMAIDSSVSGNVIGVSGANVSLMTMNVSGDILVTQTLSGMGNTAYAAWAPDGVTIFASDPTGNDIKIIGYSVGIISLHQTLTVAGAAAAGFTPDGLRALVCSPSLNHVSDLFFTSTWAVSGTTAIGTPSSVAVVSQTTAYVGCSSGLATMTYGGGHWSVAGVIALPYIPTSIYVDRSQIYTVGTAGPSGYMSLIQGGAVAYSGSWVGRADGLVEMQGQAIVGDRSIPILRVMGISGTRLIQMGSATAPSGVASLVLTGPTVLAAGISEVLEYNLTAPFVMEPVRRGIASIYDGAAWHSAVLGSSHLPMAGTFDVSGNLKVVTLQNDIYTISPSGNILIHTIVNQDGDQPQTTPIGLASIQYQDGTLYGATVLNDSLVEIE